MRALSEADGAVALSSELVVINPALLAEVRGNPSNWRPFNLNVGGTSTVVTTTSFAEPNAGIESWIASGENAQLTMVIENGRAQR